MTNQEYIEYATDKWMELFKKKSTLSEQDLDTMETLITHIIEGALRFKEQQLIERTCDTIKHLLGGYVIRNFNFEDSYDTDRLIEDLIKELKGE